jgi:hypothetical protein
MRRRDGRNRVFNVWQWGAVAVCSLVVLVYLVILDGKVLGYKLFGPPSPISRESFRESLVGKTPDEVIQSIGRPVRTRKVGRQEVWTYERRTYDPISSRVDHTASVWFENGQVDDVNY